MAQPPKLRVSAYLNGQTYDSITTPAEVVRNRTGLTKQIAGQPHSAREWLKRGEQMLRYGFPELGAGDAYKAKLLMERNQDENLSLWGWVYGVLGPSLKLCHCHWEARDLYEEAVEKDANESYNKRLGELRRHMQRKELAAAPLGGTAQEKKDRLRDGGVLTVTYPWMQKRHRDRSGKLVELINEELRETGGGAACRVGQSSLCEGSEEDMLGMFATRDIQKGECILTSCTAMSACSDPVPKFCANCYSPRSGSHVQAQCCSDVFCSVACHELAMSTYHKALCGKDFSWLQDAARGLTHNASPLRPLLMLRVLAACVQAGVEKSPLDHPLVARLKSLADRDHLDVFTLGDSVATPLKILEHLGVDIFENQNFDVDVLHTIWTRLANNKAGSRDAVLGFVDEVTPHLPLFNHSCEPNVEWAKEEGSTTVRFFAKSEMIRQGDELFCNYLDVRGLGLRERNDALWPWFEGECLCNRCKRERAHTLKSCIMSMD